MTPLTQLVETVVNISGRPLTLSEVLSEARAWSPTLAEDPQAVADVASSSRAIRRQTVRVFGQKLRVFAAALPK